MSLSPPSPRDREHRDPSFTEAQLREVKELASRDPAGPDFRVLLATAKESTHCPQFLQGGGYLPAGRGGWGHTAAGVELLPDTEELQPHSREEMSGSALRATHGIERLRVHL